MLAIFIVIVLVLIGLGLLMASVFFDSGTEE